MKIILSELVARMYSNHFMYTVYYIPTKQLISISDDMDDVIEDYIIEDIDNSLNIINIPEVNQKEIMKSYIFNLENVKDQEVLLETFNKPNLYKNFKVALNSLGLATDYFEYEENIYNREATNWCKENNLEFEG